MKKLIIVICGITIYASCLANNVAIKFATEASYPPFEHITADGRIHGFDIEVMNALCNTIGASCTIVNQPFDSLIPSLKLGKFDAIIGALAITAERAQQVDFSAPYYVNTVNFVVAKTTPLNISPDGLKNKIIGAQSGTTFARYIDDTYGKIAKIKLYASNEDGLLDLKNGRIDTYFCDVPFIKQWLKKGNEKYFTISDKPINNQQYFGNGNGIAVKKGNIDLLNALNTALAKIKADGTLEHIKNNYFGTVNK